MADGSGFRADESPQERPLERSPLRWLQGIRGMAVVAAIVVLAALVVVPRTSEDEGAGGPEEAVEITTSTGQETPVDPLLDSDGDGLPDVVEVVGWKTVGGRTHKTDPQNPDTDFDGLSDGEEAGTLVEKVGAVPLYAGISDPTKKDSDDDGLDDLEEVRGWRTTRGFTFVTDPMKADTDGDGLSDGIEAGALEGGDDATRIYAGYSDPLQIDTDKDGVDDGVEADHGTDPYARDTDHDDLTDFEEIVRLGTDPTNADTDGDGFDDRYEVQNRDSEGLDPLFYD